MFDKPTKVILKNYNKDFTKIKKCYILVMYKK